VATGDDTRGNRRPSENNLIASRNIKSSHLEDFQELEREELVGVLCVPITADIHPMELDQYHK